MISGNHSSSGSCNPLRIYYLFRRNPMAMGGMSDLNPTVDEPGREPDLPVSAQSTPGEIGRYRIERILGKGGFGLVYLAHDHQLQRLVAIKVPHRTLVDRPEDAEVGFAGCSDADVPTAANNRLIA